MAQDLPIASNFPVFVGSQCRELTAEQVEAVRVRRLSVEDRLNERIDKLEAELKAMKVELKWKGINT